MWLNKDKEAINGMSEEDRRYRDNRGGDRHARAEPYKRNRSKVNPYDYLDDELDTEERTNE